MFIYYTAMTFAVLCAISTLGEMLFAVIEGPSWKTVGLTLFSLSLALIFYMIAAWYSSNPQSYELPFSLCEGIGT